MNEQKNRPFELAGRRIRLKAGMVSLIVTLALVLLWGAAIPAGNDLNNPDFTLNAGITGITFLTVFFIQRSGKGRSQAIQADLIQAVRADRYLGPRIIHVNEMNEEELDHLHAYYQRLSDTKD